MSQFTIYKSSDGSAPSITNVAGTLFQALRKILVAGYGSQSGAGWTNPTVTNNDATIANVTRGAFLNASAANPTGGGGAAGFYLDVDDTADVPTAAGNEARIRGFESMSGVGTGSGQFPNPAAAQYSRGCEVSPYGWLNVRKSKDANAKTWVAFADAYTLYFFILSEATSQYQSFIFGDFYSLCGTSDNWRCMIGGRGGENSAGFSLGSTDMFSVMPNASSSLAGCLGCSGSQTPITFYLNRTYGGGGSTGITAGRHGDALKNGNATSLDYGYLVFSFPTATYSTGGLQTPNGPDNSYYVSPIWVHEPGIYSGGITAGTVRGRMRGFWQICHPVGSFSDGQIFTATGALQGKTFYIIKTLENGGCLAIETSATLETN
jgi:hypothetical protein